MVFRKISTELKERAIWLWENDYLTEEITEITGASIRSVQRWRNNVDQYGSVLPPKNPLQGRPPMLTGDEMHELLSKVTAEPWMYLDEIQEWITLTTEKAMTRPRIHQILRDVGFTFKLLRKQAAERDEEWRSDFRDWCQQNLRADMIIAVDESSKDDRTLYRHYGRAISGERASIDAAFVRGERWSLLPAMTVDGYIATKLVLGSVDGATFMDFILNDVMPQMQPYPGPRSVILMDNCSIHKSDELRNAVESIGSRIVFIPSYSPDYNPIELSFSCIKYWLRRHYNRIVEDDEPDMQLLEACSAISKENARAWFASCGYV